VTKVLAQYNVKPNMARYNDSFGGITVNRIENAAFAGDGLYYFEMRRETGVFGKDGNPVLERDGRQKVERAGHVIAVERVGTTYRLFDPNYGEFKLDGLDRFREFMKDYLKRTTYETKYLAGLRIIGFNPPPPVPHAASFPGSVDFKAGSITHLRPLP
jgi:hypothetical protein